MRLSDNPIRGSGDDEFGFSEHAEVLCDAIMQTQDLPLTVGIFGPWGSGKSSFLNICHDLLKERGFVSVRFDPWRYDRRDEIWHALIQSLLDELIRRAEDSSARNQLRKAIKDARRLQGVLFRLAARSIVPLVTAGKITGTDVDTNIEAIKAAVSPASRKRQMQLDYRNVNTFEEDFADTVKALAEGGRVLVLVDDLDRCRGESALMTLEALRLFTGVAPCVFVIAMDYQALIEAASARFGKEKAARGRNYLEKLINFPYYLPGARSDSISGSLRKQLGYLGDDNTMWQLIQLNMDGNPRRIRRFINTFNLAIATMERGVKNLTEERQRQVAVLLMFRQEHPEFFEVLLHDEGAWAELESVALQCAAGNRPDGLADLPPNLGRLVEDDPRLLDAIASVVPKQKGYDFPPHSTREQISTFTKAMVLPRQSLPVAAPTLAPTPGGSLSG